MAALAGVIAHGGVAGAVVEALVAIAVTGFLLAVWLRERHSRRSNAPAELTDADD